MKWYDHIKVEDLPEDFQLVADAIGMENLIKLVEKLPKVYIYLKSADKLFLPAKRQYILAARAAAGPDAPFKPRRVALEAGVSVDFVYKLLSEMQERAKQGDLFDSD